MQKKSLFATGLVTGIVFWLLLAGCASSPTVSPTPTMQKTPTATDSPTALPSPTAQKRPTVTPLPRHRLLQQPNFQQLVQLITDIRHQADEYRVDDSWKRDVLFKGPFALDALIAADLQQYYGETMPNTSQYIEQMPDDWVDLLGLPAASIEEILSKHSIVDYLNEKQIRFSENEEQDNSLFDAQAYELPIETAPDVEKNWLVKVDVKQDGMIFWIPLAEDKNGKYRLIPNDITGYSTFYDDATELKMGVDLNNDHQNDFIIKKKFYVGGAYFQFMSIYASTDQKISLLGLINFPQGLAYMGGDDLGDYEIGDHNQDGLVDIELIHPKFDVFGCAWQQKTIIQFEGTKRTEQMTGTEIPDKPECSLARMLKSDKPDEMVSLLKVARSNLPQDASSDLRSWIQLRLAMAYYAQGNDQNALQELDAIATFPKKGKGGFQKAFENIYQQVGPFPLRICEMLYTMPQSMMGDREKFGSEVYDALVVFGAYPSTGAPPPEKVCPYLDILKLRLQIQKPDSHSSPEQTFSALGMKLSHLYQVNLDADADLEWIGLLGNDLPKIVFLDRVGGVWKIIRDQSEYLYRVVTSDLQAKMLDVNGDDHPEIVLSFVDTSSSGDTCDKNNQHSFSLEILNVQEDFSTLVHKTFDCVEQSPIDSLSRQQMIDLYNETKDVDPMTQVKYPAWMKFHAVNNVNSVTLLDDVEKVQELVLANTQPQQAQTQIAAILASLPEHDSAADALRERLFYLLGYSYELQGDDEKALEIYLVLIEKNPQSLWSRLAESRLSLKP